MHVAPSPCPPFLDTAEPVALSLFLDMEFASSEPVEKRDMECHRYLIMVRYLETRLSHIVRYCLEGLSIFNNLHGFHLFILAK